MNIAKTLADTLATITARRALVVDIVAADLAGQKIGNAPLFVACFADTTRIPFCENADGVISAFGGKIMLDTQERAELVARLLDEKAQRNNTGVLALSVAEWAPQYLASLDEIAATIQTAIAAAK